MFRQDTRALNDLCIAGWIRSLPPPQPGCPSGDPGPLPVPYLSTDVVELFAYVGARFEAAARIEGFVYCRLDPVATTTPAGLPVCGPRFASGSVFVDPRLPIFCLRGFGGRVSTGSEMRRCTNTEPGAIATGYSVDYEPRCFVRILAH